MSRCLAVQEIGVSLVKERSFAKCVLGAGKCTTWPSSISSISCHGITWGDHRKSFRKMHSASCTPTQAKLTVAGLQKVLYIEVNGLSKNVLPHFALPVIITFLYLPLLTVSRNRFSGTPLFARISSAQIFYWPLQPSVHSFCLASSNISIHLFFDRSRFFCAFSISYAAFNKSATAQGVQLMRNSA